MKNLYTYLSNSNNIKFLINANIQPEKIDIKNKCINGKFEFDNELEYFSYSYDKLILAIGRLLHFVSFRLKELLPVNIFISI